MAIMTEGTRSWLFGFHNILHSIAVYVAWIKLYKKIPTFMETFCILIHDVGYCGMNYITNKSHEGHEVLGAKIAGHIFGKKGYDLCIGHRSHGKALEVPDEYSHILMPMWVIQLQHVFENGEDLLQPPEWKAYTQDRGNKRLAGVIVKREFTECFK